MIDSIPMTVGELRALIDDVGDSVWVIVAGDGPATRLVRELGANEPFMVIESPPAA